MSESSYYECCQNYGTHTAACVREALHATWDERCWDCEDAIAIHTWDTDPYGYGPVAARYVSLCKECWTARDNYEPSDQDGEEMFRNPQAEARDAMDTARRLK